MIMVVLGILAAVASVAFTRCVQRSKIAEALHDVPSIDRGQVTCYNCSDEPFAEPSLHLNTGPHAE